MSDVIKDIKDSQLATYHRGKSWEYCYTFFRNYKKFRGNNEFLDHAALHLGFFLASWGMLRGSSFLLQKDYKFYIPIVKILIDSKYEKLWSFDFSQKSREQNINLLFGLEERLKAVFVENNRKDGDNKEHKTELIITKIIMATMGCAPSYDRYFKDGLKKMGWGALGTFKQDSFQKLLGLTERHKELKGIYEIQCFIKDSDIKHPPMKLLDLYFWLLGSQK